MIFEELHLSNNGNNAVLHLLAMVIQFTIFQAHAFGESAN